MIEGNLSDLIGNVAFPIIAVIYLELRSKQMSKNYRVERKSFIRAINNNTEVLKDIKEMLRKGGEERWQDEA